MPTNHFDQASRYTVKLDPTGFLAWALGLADTALAFRGLLDTRGVSFPGDTDRTGDTVARLDDPAANLTPWAVAVEFQIEPDPLMFGRLLVYLGQLWLAVKPDPERGSRFNVAAVVVNLTGTGTASRRMEWPGAGLATRLAAVERNMARENADELLGTIESGTRSRSLLPWIPLMTGGDDAGIIQRWLRAAEAEPEYHRRTELAGLARVFATAVDRRPIWDAALEGWNVKQSSLVNEWIAEGKAEGKAEGERSASAAAVVAVLEARFGQLPAELSDRIGQTTDLAALKSWLALAAKAATLAEFRASAGV